MKVVIKTYVDHYGLSYKIARLFEPFIGDEKAYDLIPVIEKIPGIEHLSKLNEKLNDWRESRRVSVRIDSWDTFSMDAVLTPIILPMLKQIRTELNGAPLCDYEDADLDLRPSKEDIARMESEPGWTDDNLFKRWDNILDKMIEAFEIHHEDDILYPDDPKKAKLENGLRLFGKYYMNLWT
jgi:hypothetical protein